MICSQDTKASVEGHLLIVSQTRTALRPCLHPPIGALIQISSIWLKLSTIIIEVMLCLRNKSQMNWVILIYIRNQNHPSHIETNISHVFPILFWRCS